jgi:ATP-dependent helicase/nuclease subunit A
MNDHAEGCIEQDIYAPSWGEIHPHLTIRASAGSGKTYQLSTRYLFLVRHGFDPSQVLATTFTRKAAGEVLGRVITRIADAVADKAKRIELSTSLKGPTLSEHDCRVMMRTLAGSLHRLSISTIDGFFNKIAQSFRLELDLPPEPKLIDAAHPVAVRLRQDAIEAMLGDDDLPALVTLLRQLHHDTAARSVTEVIDSAVTNLYDVYREAPDESVWSRLEPLGLLNQGALQSAIESLGTAAGILPTNKHWLNAYEENHHAALAHDWERFITKGLAKKIAEGGEVFQRLPVTADWFSVYEPLIGHAAGVLIQRVAKQTKATHDLLRRFDVHYSALRRRQGVLLFSDLTHKLARELPGLGGGLMEDVYFRLDSHVTHLLLDEFQDTSLSQWAVLHPFAEEVASTADGTRSLFCVGDTKQAIYGWRGGVAELFDEFEDSLGLGDESKQTLAKSYRSSRVVLDAVNDVFTDIATNDALSKDTGAAERWQKGFEAHKAVRDFPGHVTLETSTAGYNPTSEDDDDPNASAMPAGAHEIYIAQRVKALYEREGGAGSIGVLVSVNKTASKLIYELGRLGLPVSGEGGSRVADSPAVMAVQSAFVMADHPGDTAAAFHVYNSPLAKVVGLDSTKPASVRRASLNIRRSLLTRGYAKTITQWTRAVAPSCDARGLKRLTQLIELADRSEPNDTLRPSWFVDLVESARVAEPSTAPIRVMTVHGAKGLEFDTVVLADLDRRLMDRSVMLVERGSPTGPITGVYRKPKSQIRDLDEKLRKAADSQREDRLIEDLCSLYVAMTRARQALHMVIKPLELTRSGKVASKGLCFASILRDALCQEEESMDGEQVLYERGDSDWVCTAAPAESAKQSKARSDKPVALDKTVGDARRSWPTVSPSSQAGHGDSAKGEIDGARSGRPAASLLDLGSQNSAAMQYGTLIHAWMQQVGFMDEDGVPGDDSLRLVAEQIMPGVDAAWVTARLEQFNKTLTGPTSKEVLARDGAAELWRERGFAVHDRGTMLRGFFDRVAIYRDDQGQVTGATLVDFKTDRVGPGGEQELAAHYQPQMVLYRRALVKLLGVETEAVKMKLWFVGPDKLVDL